MKTLDNDSTLRQRATMLYGVVPSPCGRCRSIDTAELPMAPAFLVRLRTPLEVLPD